MTVLPPVLVGQIAAWATAGFPCVKVNYAYRFQATYANTFVKSWMGPTIGAIERDWVCQDVHYTPAGALQALGGFWIGGVNGAALPQQEWRNNTNSPMRAQLYQDIVALIPVPAPDKTTALKWETVMEFVQGLNTPTPAGY